MGRLHGAALTAACLAGLATGAGAQVRPCEDLRADIATRMNIDPGSYRLDIVDAEAESAGQVVGRCEGGRRKIVYVRLAGAAAPAAPTASSPSTTPGTATPAAAPRPRPGGGAAAAPADGQGPVDRWIEQLGLGAIKVSLPDTLRQGEAGTLELSMQTDAAAEALRRQINTAAARDANLPRAGGQMHARVVAAQWRVAPLTPTQQAVAASAPTVWRWEVTPLAAGAQRLHITLGALLSQGGASETRTVRSFDKAVDVQARPGPAAWAPLAQWQRYAGWAAAALAALLALGAGWWLGRRGRRGR